MLIVIAKIRTFSHIKKNYRSTIKDFVLCTHVFNVQLATLLSDERYVQFATLLSDERYVQFATLLSDERHVQFVTLLSDERYVQFATLLSGKWYVQFATLLSDERYVQFATLVSDERYVQFATLLSDERYMYVNELRMDHLLCWRPSTHLRGCMHSKRMFGSDVQCQWITRQTTLPSWKNLIKQCSPCTRIKRTKIVVIDWSWKFSTTSGLL